MKSKFLWIISVSLFTRVFSSNVAESINSSPLGIRVDPTKIFVIIGNTFNDQIKYYPQITGVTMIVEVEGLKSSIVEKLLSINPAMHDKIKDWDVVASDKRYSHAIYTLNESAEGDTKVFTRFVPKTTVSDSISLPNEAFIRSNLRELKPEDANAIVKYILVSSINEKIGNTLPERIIFYCMDSNPKNQFNQLTQILTKLDPNQNNLKADSTN